MTNRRIRRRNAALARRRRKEHLNRIGLLVSATLVGPEHQLLDEADWNALRYIIACAIQDAGGSLHAASLDQSGYRISFTPADLLHGLMFDATVATEFERYLRARHGTGAWTVAVSSTRELLSSDEHLEACAEVGSLGRGSGWLVPEEFGHAASA